MNKVRLNGANSPQDSHAVKVSGRAANIKRWVEHLAQLPAVRQDRVEEFSRQLQSGTYHPNASDIAQALMRDESGRP